jgi:hypothetical protein
MSGKTRLTDCGSTGMRSEFLNCGATERAIRLISMATDYPAIELSKRAENQPSCGFYAPLYHGDNDA